MTYQASPTPLGSRASATGMKMIAFSDWFFVGVARYGR
jgi:hypothetical protein